MPAKTAYDKAASADMPRDLKVAERLQRRLGRHFASARINRDGVWLMTCGGRIVFFDYDGDPVISHQDRHRASIIRANDFFELTHIGIMRRLGSIAYARAQFDARFAQRVP
jgi:hypothetical protein